MNSTRNEDERYTIENDTLAIIMPNTDINGASIVKNRIKDSINDLSLKLKQEKNYVNIDTKISILLPFSKFLSSTNLTSKGIFSYSFCVNFFTFVTFISI